MSLLSKAWAIIQPMVLKASQFTLTVTKKVFKTCSSDVEACSKAISTMTGSDYLPAWVIRLALLAVLALALVIWVTPFELSETAQFGDTFGVLTSIFSGLAVYAAFTIIKLQKKEMQALKETLERQVAGQKEAQKLRITEMFLAQWQEGVNRLQDADVDEQALTDKKILFTFERRIIPVLRHIYTSRDSVNISILQPIIKHDFKTNESIILAYSDYEKAPNHIEKHIVEYFDIQGADMQRIVAIVRERKASYTP